MTLEDRIKQQLGVMGFELLRYQTIVEEQRLKIAELEKKLSEDGN